MSDMKQRLLELRRTIEEDADLAEVEMPAAVLLSDVCMALGLEEADRQEVLGPHGAQYVEALLGGRVSLMCVVSPPVFEQLQSATSP